MAEELDSRNSNWGILRDLAPLMTAGFSTSQCIRTRILSPLVEKVNDSRN
jgi:hypothetical protein